MSDTTNKVRRVSFADRREDDSKPWYVGYAELDEDPNGTHMLVPIEEWNQREAEIERLHGRIEELEIAFAHYHTPENIGSSDPPSDKCKQCGFDIRDQIHLRVDDLRIGARR